MMFAREPALHTGGRRGLSISTSYSPPSPINYSSHQNDIATPPSPIKTETGGSYYNTPSSPALKLEPMSPSSCYLRSTQSSAMDWQQSPSASSLDSVTPHSPLSSLGGGFNFTSASSPVTSPLSPSSTATLSPSIKIGREDLSPTSSVNSTLNDHSDKKKKSGGSRQSEELCLVCGDRASGYHYNALTCEGCKGFFRRSITRKAVYSCKYGQNCEMDMYMRRKCQECRFKKCINVGMRPECVTKSPDCPPSTGVVPEHTCQVKREQKKAREKDKGKSPYPPIDFGSPTQKCSPGLTTPISSLPTCLSSGNRIDLTKDQQELINRLINIQNDYELPEDVYKLKTPSTIEEKLQHLIHSTKSTVELIVQCAINLPGFNEVCKEDQVVLVKASVPELLNLRAARRYDLDSDCIVFADECPYTRDYYFEAGLDPSNTDSLFNFCKRMADMKVDDGEYALLAAITLFSERPDLLNREYVEKIQYFYVETLYAYVTNKWAPKSGTMVAKLLDVLTQLRSLGNRNNEQCQSLIAKNIQLPDLILEILDER